MLVLRPLFKGKSEVLPAGSGRCKIQEVVDKNFKIPLTKLSIAYILGPHLPLWAL